MRRVLRATKEVAANTLTAVSDDRVTSMAAALAYFTFFSIAPVVIIAIAIAGAIFGDEAARGALSDQLEGLVGRPTADIVENLVKGASGPKRGVIATLMGAVAILFGATGVFAELQDALNTVWKVAPKKRHFVASFFRARFRSFAVVLGVGFLLLVSLLISVALSTVCGWFGECSDTFARLTETTVSFLITALLFGLIFKLLPDTRVSWRDVWHGAVITSVLFTLGKYALGWVLGRSTFLSTYGTAASIAALLLWVHYSSLILLVGAELAHELSVRAPRNRRAEPRDAPGGLGMNAAPTTR